MEFYARMDFSLYAFMFPVAIFIATVAMLSGIAGTALFVPVFLLGFPLLGDEYLLNSPVEAIAVALLTSSFGFASGFIAYFRKGLIDFRLSRSFILLSVPAAVSGAIVSPWIEAGYIRLFYGLLMLIIAIIIFRKEGSVPIRNYSEETIRAKLIPTLTGGFLTGLLSVGIGEVVMPQLLRQGKITLPVAAASSVLIVIITVVSASFTHIFTLTTEGGINAVPWHLVCYTIPGVVIGGQIGPRLQGRFSSSKMEKAIASVFVLIGLAMISTFLRYIWQ